MTQHRAPLLPANDSGFFFYWFMGIPALIIVACLIYNFISSHRHLHLVGYIELHIQRLFDLIMAVYQHIRRVLRKFLIDILDTHYITIERADFLAQQQRAGLQDRFEANMAKYDAALKEQHQLLQASIASNGDRFEAFNGLLRRDCLDKDKVQSDLDALFKSSAAMAAKSEIDELARIIDDSKENMACLRDELCTVKHSVEAKSNNADILAHDELKSLGEKIESLDNQMEMVLKTHLTMCNAITKYGTMNTFFNTQFQDTLAKTSKKDDLAAHFTALLAYIQGEFTQISRFVRPNFTNPSQHPANLHPRGQGAPTSGYGITPAITPSPISYNAYGPQPGYGHQTGYNTRPSGGSYSQHGRQ